ncbi:MAG TPA: pyrophosphorylase [Enteractinococcus sp.]
MSAARVLSTEEAKTAIRQIQSIINGGFTDQITQLDNQGLILSDPNVWDGPLAATFRGSTWPETKAALDNAKEQLEQLRLQLDKISQDIFTAGGGA